MNEITPIEMNNQRILLTSQLAEFYGATEKVISNNFNNNKSRYKEGRDYFCLEGDALKQFKRESENLGIAPNANKLYLWTEHGALLHAKSLGTDEAWKVYGQLVDTYFQARETAIALPSPESQKATAQLKRADAMLKNANRKAAEFLHKVMTEAGVEPVRKVKAVQAIMGGESASHVDDGLTVERPTYSAEQIAAKLGILSKAGKPHGQAVGAILSMLNIPDGEKELAPYQNHGHSDTIVKYTEKVVGMVRGYLDGLDWPNTINSTSKKFMVVYGQMVRKQ